MASHPDASTSSLGPDVPLGQVLSGEVADIWGAGADDGTSADEDCGPTKVCRNAREFSFEGISEGGGDLGTAWRNLLKEEGKLANSGTESIRDLMLGNADD